MSTSTSTPTSMSTSTSKPKSATYQGRCHCGAVQFSMKLSPPVEDGPVTKCNCSICRANGYLMVYPLESNVVWERGGPAEKGMLYLFLSFDYAVWGMRGTAGERLWVVLLLPACVHAGGWCLHPGASPSPSSFTTLAKSFLPLRVAFPLPSPSAFRQSIPYLFLPLAT